MIRIIILIIAISSFFCKPKNNPKFNLNNLDGRYYCKDTGRQDNEIDGFGSYSKVLKFKNGTCEYVILDYDNIMSTKGKYITLENNLMKNHILVLVPDPEVADDGDTIVGSPYYFDIVDYNDSTLFIRDESQWQRKRFGKIKKFEHKIEAYKLDIK